MRNAFTDIMIHAKFHFNRLMLTLIFGIRASQSRGPGERLKRPGLIGLNEPSRKVKNMKFFALLKTSEMHMTTYGYGKYDDKALATEHKVSPEKTFSGKKVISFEYWSIPRS